MQSLKITTCYYLPTEAWNGIHRALRSHSSQSRMDFTTLKLMKNTGALKHILPSKGKPQILLILLNYCQPKIDDVLYIIFKCLLHNLFGKLLK